MENKQIRNSYSIAGFVALIAGVCPQFLLSFLIPVLFPDVDNPFLTTLLPLVLGYAILIPVAWLIVRRFELPGQMPERHALSFKKMFPWFMAFFALSRIIALITNLIQMAVVGEDYVDPVTFMQMNSPGMMFVLLVFVAPVAEELVFRGLLYKVLAPYGGKCFVLISALLFGLFHMNFVQIPFAFVLGLFFAYIMYRTGNILIPMLFHFITNLTSGVAILFFGSETGTIIAAFVVFAIIIVGVIFGIVLMAKKRARQDIVFQPAIAAPATAGHVFGNVGIVLAIAVMIALTIVVAITWNGTLGLA